MGSIVIREFHEALNAVAQPTTKSASYADAMSNVILSTRNAVAKKDGTEPINSVAFGGGEEILSIFDFLFMEGDVVRKVIFQSGTNLFEVHEASGTAGVIKSGLSPREFQYQVSNKITYMGNGEQMLKYYAIAGYSIFGDEERKIEPIYDSTQFMAQSFISEHGKDRNCASISLVLIRNGSISSSTKVTIEIQTDASGIPSGTPIPNGVSNQIDGDKLRSNWEWVSFTFGSTLPILETGVTYWIVFKTSNDLSSGTIGWGIDGTDPEFEDGVFAEFDFSTWTTFEDPNKKVGLFQVFAEPDKWGIDAPTTAPTLTSAPVNNPFNDIIANQDADEEILPDGPLAQSWKFFGDDDERTVSSVQVFLKKNGANTGSVQISIHNDAGGTPASSILAKSNTVKVQDLGSSYAFQLFTLEEPITLRGDVKYWLVVSGDELYAQGFVTGVDSVDWGIETLGLTFGLGEFASFIDGEWILGGQKDSMFRITSSRQSAGGRKYAISFKNSATEHVSNRGPATERSGNVDDVILSDFEIPTDPQVDLILIWATTDGGEIFFLLLEQTVNTFAGVIPVDDSFSSPGAVDILTDAASGVKGPYFELVASTPKITSWLSISVIADQGGSPANFTAEIDIALGASGFEVVVIPDIVYSWEDETVDGHDAMVISFPFEIPAGSRIAVRASDDRGDDRGYRVALTGYNPSTLPGPALVVFTDTISEDDLDFTIEAPLCNFPPQRGNIISRVRDSIIVAGVQTDNRKAFFSAGLGQTLVGVPEESFPAFNFVTVPAGSERIFNIDSLDGAPVIFTTDQLFTIAGATPESFRIAELRGGEGVGSVSKEGSAATELGLFFMSTDKKVYLIPTMNHIPQLVSAVVEDEFERITSDSSTLEIRAMEKLRMSYWHFGDRHWVIIAFATGSSLVNNELWIYDIDLHNIHQGQGWMGPITLAGGEGFQVLRIITDATHEKRLFIGDQSGFIREYGVGLQDGGADFSSSYTFPFMDDNKPHIVKDGLVAEVVVPAGQTIPANFLEVSYDSETDFEVIPLTRVNEMERGASSSNKYRGYLVSHFTRIKPRINFAVENLPGELWQLRIDYDDMYDTRGFINDA